MTRKKTVKNRESREKKTANASIQDPESLIEEPAPVPSETTAVAVSEASTALTVPVRRNIASPIGPWSRLTRAWLRESEKLHAISVDRMGSVIDDSHRLALEGVATITSISLTYQRGMLDQLERNVALLATFGRSAA
jgi:hypothetical protein